MPTTIQEMDPPKRKKCYPENVKEINNDNKDSWYLI